MLGECMVQTIFILRAQGYSERQIASELGISRNTVRRYLKHRKQEETLMQECYDNGDENGYLIHKKQMTTRPMYDTSLRKGRVYTLEMAKDLLKILEEEDQKKGLKTKQKLTTVQIHAKLLKLGHKVSLSTINSKVKELREKPSETFIYRQFGYGERAEYDFGSVVLNIKNEKQKTFYLVVITSPASKLQLAYLYRNQQQEAFIDSHNRAFRELNGVFKKIVYDNMRNSVARFATKKEDKKVLNPKLLEMASFFNFQPVLTNTYAGNEKGSVEASVRHVTNHVFADRNSFETFEEAEEYLAQEMIRLNKDRDIETEKQYLLPYKGHDYDYSEIRISEVNSYSLIQVHGNSYPVPDIYTKKQLEVRIYLKVIQVFKDNELICYHPREEDGANKIILNYRHYIRTFATKPGGILDSKAIQDSPELITIFKKYFSTNATLFIDILRENVEKDDSELVKVFEEYLGLYSQECKDKKTLKEIINEDNYHNKTRNSLSKYDKLSSI